MHDSGSVNETEVVDDKDLAYHALDYIQHIQWVMEGLAACQVALGKRALTHDRSKIVPGMERDIYAQVVPQFASVVFGTPEHKAVGDKLGSAWDHHLRHNRHHPEHHSNGINDMSLIDLLEMVCDWKAAGLRKETGGLENSLKTLQAHHGIEPQLAAILRNTFSILDDAVHKLSPWSQHNDTLGFEVNPGV